MLTLSPFYLHVRHQTPNFLYYKCESNSKLAYVQAIASQVAHGQPLPGPDVA